MKDVLIKVPATSANLGPGFDIFGLALNKYAYFRISYHSEPDNWHIYDKNNNILDIPPEHNLLKTGFERAVQSSGINKSELDPAAFSLSALFRMDLPVGSGFGSSACALTAGVMYANHLIKGLNPDLVITPQKELDLLTELEGHPDNAVPARIGGFVFSSYSEGNEPLIIRKELPADLGLAVIIPSFQVSTAQSRRELPAEYAMKDILSNLRGSLLWMEYIHSGNPQFLIHALQSDQLHEKFRGRNIPGFFNLKEKIHSIGCYGITISGSGPGLLVYYPKYKETDILKELSELIRVNSEKDGYPPSPVEVCQPDYTGAVLTEVHG
jgi:homoserine kinase